MKGKAEGERENTAPAVDPRPTYDLSTVFERVLSGRIAEPDEAILRNVIAEGLEKLRTQEQTAGARPDPLQQLLDFHEITFALLVLVALLGTKRLAGQEKPSTKVAVVLRGETLGLQLWTREDGSDARFRPLTDLEEATLFQHFQKKISHP